MRARNERTHKTSLAHVERSPCKPSQEAGKEPTWQRVFPIHNHGDGNNGKERESREDERGVGVTRRSLEVGRAE